MAILIRGSSACPLCRRTIQSDDAVKLFPHFAPDHFDPVSIFSDAAVHSACLHEHPLSQAAIELVARLDAKVGRGLRLCDYCGQSIGSPSEFFSLGFLTSDRTSPLYAFNYAQTHRACLSQWPGRLVLLELLKGSEASLGASTLAWLRSQL